MSWFPLPNGKALAVAVVLAIISWLAFSNWGYRKDLQRVKQQLSTVEMKNSKLAGLITTLQVQDAENRVLIAAQQQREQQLRQQHNAIQRKYREAIKNDPCATERMPSAVVELLQQNSTGTTANRPTTP
ncbi:hypothetical protein ACJ8PP_06115 [Serratia sp. CY82423]|uniref:hypothetical protein n=1 Tax=Serratia sp. CY82423 TaxID=3383688 RepID=UPI003F9EC111